MVVIMMLWWMGVMNAGDGDSCRHGDGGGGMVVIVIAKQKRIEVDSDDGECCCAFRPTLASL